MECVDVMPPIVDVSGKVFCINCAYYWDTRGDFGGDEYCRAVYDIQWTYLQTRIAYGMPLELNKDNVCRHYKPSRWYLFRCTIVQNYRRLIKWLKHPLHGRRSI